MLLEHKWLKTMRRATSGSTGPFTSRAAEPLPTPTFREAEADVRATILAFFETWAKPRAEVVEAALVHVAPDFTGIGTGPGDYYPDRVALGVLLGDEREGMTAPDTFEMPWLFARVLRPGLALAEGQIRSEIEAGGGNPRRRAPVLLRPRAAG